ncbi:MAG: carboxypeptidase-like regulatory domain-containing protein [Bacteroidales bacterium]|nr:carboxypeptidase-like regulatory domain-containing protein [Bacteroidales bacterium]
MKRIVLALIIMSMSLSIRADHLGGRVFLRDTTVTGGDFVMVYCEACGTGTLTDEKGYYSLEIPGSSGQVKIEFSRIGYTTVYVELDGTGGDIELEDVILEPQPLMLTAAYVIPDGMDPGAFVLSKVWEQSKKNSNKQQSYSADIIYDIVTHDIPTIARMIPKGMLGIVKVAVAMKGFGPLFRYCIDNDDLAATVSLRRNVVKGKAKDHDQQIVRSDQELPKNVQKNIMSVFGLIDLYDMIYGETAEWGEKFSSRNHFDLVGTYEYGGKLVDVLEWSDPKMMRKATVHVVEDDWGILKVQMFSNNDEVMRCEARDTGSGVYMPVSFVLKPTVTMVSAEQIPELIEMIKNNEEMSKKLKERSIKVLEENLGKDLNPYISFSFNIKYI